MPVNKKRQYLICYDIRCPKRLQRVHACIKKYAVPVQYSVFHTQMRDSQLETLKEKLQAIIDNKHDDIRIYPLPVKPVITVIGQPFLPEGVTLLD